MVKTLSRDSLIRLCHLDYSREMALVAERNHELIGVSRYYMNPQTRVAEFAVVVSDAFQGQGLGEHLMQRLIETARERGVKRLTGSVLRENHRMLALSKELGFHELKSSDASVIQMALDL
jgi:acetyltransferase